MSPGEKNFEIQALRGLMTLMSKLVFNLRQRGVLLLSFRCSIFAGTESVSILARRYQEKLSSTVMKIIFSVLDIGGCARSKIDRKKGLYCF